ncbi:MAG: hypothetical protein SPL50_02505 [Alloprevotella sp.]|nr:hypothetical protein [Alloprevotella sp.]
MKEIKEIMLPARCAALSAISALSVGLLVSHADSIYCPAKMKEIKEIQVSDIALDWPSASKFQEH